MDLGDRGVLALGLAFVRWRWPEVGAVCLGEMRSHLRFEGPGDGYWVMLVCTRRFGAHQVYPGAVLQWVLGQAVER